MCPQARGLVSESQFAQLEDGISCLDGCENPEMMQVRAQHSGWHLAQVRKQQPSKPTPAPHNLGASGPGIPLEGPGGDMSKTKPEAVVLCGSWACSTRACPRPAESEAPGCGPDLTKPPRRCRRGSHHLITGKDCRAGGCRPLQRRGQGPPPAATVYLSGPGGRLRAHISLW